MVLSSSSADRVFRSRRRRRAAFEFESRLINGKGLHLYRATGALSGRSARALIDHN
jgi:hypothetical protein